MKRCPDCGRDYNDDSLSFCLDDGAELLFGPKSFDEPQTAIFHDTDEPGEAATRAQIHATEGEARGTLDGRPERQSRFASNRAKPLAAAGIAILLAGIGFFGYRYAADANSGAIDSIAVLPLINQSGNPDTDYLSDGIAESLIFRLSQLPGLKVSPVSSVIRYKGKEFDPQKIAGELGVQAVMSGRMAQRGENLSISIELIDAESNKVLWGEQYERKMSDLLATQREIASTITQKLQLKLSGNETGLTKKYTSSNEAYELYLRGRFHFARRTKVDLERSVELLQQATRLDPEFALAYVGIAEAYSSMTSFPYLEPRMAYPVANAAITRALEIDPELPEAYAVSGMLAATYEWDYPKAERAFKRGIELGPNLAITHFRYGWTYLSAVGRHEEAISEMKRAVEIEPLAVQQGSNYSAVLLYARRFDEALEQARRTYELDPTQIGAQNWLCHPLNAKGLYIEAITVGERAAKSQVNTVTSFAACLGVAYARSGQREKSLELLATVKEMSKTSYVSSYWMAAHYVALGDREAAFSELEKAFERRDWFLRYIRTDFYMDPLRGDPRFDAIVNKLDLPK